MFEKVNPAHPDKVADRIAGALVDYAYTQQDNPRVAIEVLIGHGMCHIIAETSVDIPYTFARDTVARIAGYPIGTTIMCKPQDPVLANNQFGKIRCGDNGIFLGMPMTDEEIKLTAIAQDIYRDYPTDGKYLLDGDRLVICQSCASTIELKKRYPNAIINPLGDWPGGLNVDTGATNRKLGSDMGRSITGGGLHGKDLSKADVSINIYAWLQAYKNERPFSYMCAIGDEIIDGVPFAQMVLEAREYIETIGGFERFAEWGLIG